LCFIDTLDENERKNFNAISFQQIAGHQPSKIILPEEENSMVVSIDPIGDNVILLRSRNLFQPILNSCEIIMSDGETGLSGG
jgi:hypothetical protein